MPNTKKRNAQTNSTIRALKLLDVLKEKTDSTKPLSQAELLRYLKERDDSCTEKTLRSDLRYLMEHLNPPYYADETKNDFRILYDGIENGRKRMSNIYYVHDFSDRELDIIIESLKFHRGIDEATTDTLIQKIKGFGRSEYDDKVMFISKIPELESVDKRGLEEKISVIRYAIKNKVKISFYFNYYNREGHLVRKKDKRYIVNPYHMVAYNGKYYLISNTEPYHNVSIYRLDLMADVIVAKDMHNKENELPRKSISKVEGLSQHWDPKAFMREHMNMHYDTPVTVRIKVHESAYTILHEWFGDNYVVKKKLDEMSDEVHVVCSRNAMVNWAIQYSDWMEIIGPPSIRKKIENKINTLSKLYHK